VWFSTSLSALIVLTGLSDMHEAMRWLRLDVQERKAEPWQIEQVNRGSLSLCGRVIHADNHRPLVTGDPAP